MSSVSRKQGCTHRRYIVEAEDDPFEGEDELPALQELIDKVDSSCDAHVFIFTEDSIDVCLGNIDKTNPNWRNDLLEEIT